MPEYLIKQRKGWYAILEIPKALRSKLGKTRFKETLQTDSLKVAEVRKHALVAVWKAEIEAARGSSSNLDRVVLVRKKMAERKKPDPVDLAMILTPQTDEEMSDLEKNRHELSKVLHGKKFPLKQFVADYEKTLTNIEPKSKDMRLSTVRRFLKKFKYAEDATNREVKNWIETDLIAEQSLSATTCRSIVSHLRQYWKYLVDRHDLTLSEPFKDVVPARTRTRKQEVAAKRTHFESEDYQKLLKACNDSQVETLMRLGVYTGCRIEELCSLKLEAVKEDRILIQDAKTESGWRTTPLHKEIVKLVADLTKSSKDGYLISGLSYNKYGDRSNALGKRFGRLKTACGYGRNFVFHSFRKGVATQLERLGVAENISANILGHDIPSITYGLYSGNKLEFTLIRDTVNKLRW